jgi:hypothetical protein
MNRRSWIKKILLILGLIFVVFILTTVFDKQSPTNNKDLVDKKTTTTIVNSNLLNESKKQVFPSSNSTNMGSLIVESTPQGASVIIDVSKAEGPSDYPVIPSNTTPFKISTVPEGKYMYSAMKDGYDLAEGIVEIKRNEQTYLNIGLLPLDYTE